METQVQAQAQVQEGVLFREREGRGIPRPFREMPLPAGLRIPRWLATLAGMAVAAGPLAGLASRRAPAPLRLLRTTLFSSTLTYFLAAGLDLAEHLRMEKEATGHYLRWKVVPPRESVLHAAILATNFSGLVLARPLRRPMGLRDVWLLATPGVFLAIGWADELIYHRRRAPHRESIIHTVQHLAEGIMWTALYGTRLIAWKKPQRRPLLRRLTAALSRG